MDDFLIKPAEPKTVVELIRQNLSRRRKPEPKFTERLDQVIARNREEIIERWYQSVERHPDINKIRLSREDRVDHLPYVLDELVRPMDPPKEATAKSRNASHEHGETRRNQGYTLSMLLEETRILHPVVAECMQQNLLSIDLSNLIPDLVKVHDRMQGLLQDSLEEFLRGGASRAA